ncbi:MAG: CehA/McbA family metallohydrolase [Armatimonadetes bacterium]|nr:CehA/McbA family metallohydrolase [Armatimonadota bacterium]
MKAKWLLAVLLLAAVGFGSSPVRANASSVAPHGDEEMDAARQAMVTFAYATAVADGEAAAAVLHDDLTTSWGATKEGVVAQVASSRPWTKRIVLRHAFFKKVGKRIRVTPVVHYDGTWRLSLTFELEKEEKKWLIVRIEMGAETPLELQESDGQLPEHHLLFPVEVHLRDAATGEPVFARVSVTDSEGDYWPPEGHVKRIHTGWNPDVGVDAMVDGKSFAYVSSDFTLPLPVGSYDIEVVRGMEYEPFTAHFEVTDSKVVTLNIELERWSNVAQDGWFSGDTHVHFIDPTNGMLEMKGEDLNVLNILVTKWAELITNAEHFTGAPSLLSEPGHIVYVNEESRHGFLGHTILMNLRKLVYPLSWGPQAGGGVIGGHDFPTMAIQADKTHEQGGFVTWAHFPFPGGELAVDMALGKVDSIDLMTMGDAFNGIFGQLGPADTWYRFLNLGFRVPATAGTDKMQNTQVLGSVRTYVKMDGPLSYQGWIDGIRAGRTFTTTGPMIKFSVDGAGIGDTITASPDQMVTVAVEVSSRIPMERIEIVLGGEIVATKENPSGARDLSFTVEVPIDGSTWIAARTSSSEHLPFNQNIPIFAHTSPIYIDVAGRPIGSPEAAAYFAEQCEDAIEWAKTKAKVLDESQREEMIALYEKARQIYLDMVLKT